MNKLVASFEDLSGRWRLLFRRRALTGAVLGMAGFGVLWAESAGERKLIVAEAERGVITKSRFDFWIPKRPAGVLVLIDGDNLPATTLTDDPDWRRFVQEHDLALCGVEFRSPEGLLRAGRGYYEVPAGSGQLLLDALDKVGLGGRPLLLYGISGGARFVNGFLAWRPDRLKTWAAFTVSTWMPPAVGRTFPPGIVACGTYDDGRYGACLKFVQQARGLRQPVAWVSIPELGHRRSLEFEDFVREYFAAVLRPVPDDRPVTVDYLKETEVVPREPWEYLLSCELPSRRLLPSWRTLNGP